ncbi:hypothetical protein HBI56_183870 [Parastagonospora nodorum]|nr:hypothetical protein HBH56_192340 [Parastagonospora nodorum]KAH3940716.1 hypothetical protein HBH53_212690 [Parastagonospora nodorum]KAH3994216.1 hypothetical protein HBI10_189900 [Parastagonospora nodorum]KAH4013626.1 hypothetical protein HBI13_178730 [Parastagonospora nodorum]KAH4116444.1 hypothetical protein HBH47_168230 [Parastagonospora nodorum]
MSSNSPPLCDRPQQHCAEADGMGNFCIVVNGTAAGDQRKDNELLQAILNLGGRMGGEMCITPAHLDSGLDHFPSTFQGTNRSAKG